MMNNYLRLIALFFLFSISAIYGVEQQIDLGFETRVFNTDSNDYKQKRSDSAAVLKVEFVHHLDNGLDSITFIPFARFQLYDEERTHFDIRELYWESLGDNWELKVGIGQEYWGVTEFVHLVNAINQVDMLEGIDEEDRLGELMIKYTQLSSIGQFDFFLLPFFRPREYPGVEGRLRTPFLIDSNDSLYESSRNERKIEAAVRYSQTFNNVDLGLSLFHGTQRDAQFKFNKVKNKIIPYYAKSTQLGVDLQMAIKEWLIKAEFVGRRIDTIEHLALTGGFEYSFIGIMETEFDLGLIVEGAWQNKRDRYSAFSDEIIFGQRLAFNNELGSELLFGYIYDIHHNSSVLSLEASSRVNNSIKLSVEGRIFQKIGNNDPFKTFEDEDHLNLELTWYF